MTNQPDEPPSLRTIEERARFVDSALWDLQRQYFATRGVAAWRDGEVPHYVTSNPTVADSFAQVVDAFRQDRCKLGPADMPITIVELGAGSGRFGFHFLTRLARLSAAAGIRSGAFRYVMTDVVESNLAFWRSHPGLQPFFQAGTLDLALFDATRPGPLHLQISGEAVGPGDLPQPPVVVANYLFDTIPQDLFYLEAGAWYDCLATLSVEDAALVAAGDAAGLLEHLRLDLDYVPLPPPLFPEPWLDDLMAAYAGMLRRTHLLVPATGLRCVDYLSRLSNQGLMLLSTDKGDHHPDRLDGRAPPDIVRHGSVSLPVNFHAFLHVCHQRGGCGLAPEHGHRSVAAIGLLMLDDAADHGATRAAYDRHLSQFGPDDFYTLIRQSRAAMPAMSIEELLTYLRFALYDPHHFMHALPHLMALSGSLDAAQRTAVVDASERVWAQYFPLGEEWDAANGIATLLYALGESAGAYVYFERSMAIYGRDTGTLFNMAACLSLLDRPEEACILLEEVLRYDPGNEPARALLIELTAAVASG